MLRGRSASRATVGGLAVVALVVVVAACSSSGKGSSGAGSGGGGTEGGLASEGGANVEAGGADGVGGPGEGGSSGEAGAGEAGTEGGAGDASGCGEFAGDTSPTCSGDGDSLGECVGGVADVQACTYGCLYAYAQNPASCLLASVTNFSCTGSYGTVPVNDGNYYVTEFGCYVDSSGTVHTDPDDNCIPSCLSKARAAGLCPAGSTGPQCEEALDWYTADGARFGCLARLRVTNPANGKTVIAVALDYGPGCPGENGVTHAVLDASGAVDDYLFGGPEGASDRALVHVVQVADTTPLGPE